MHEENRWKIILVVLVFMVLMVLENILYAGFFMPYYKLIPGNYTVLPNFVLIMLYITHSITNFIIIMILAKIIYEYENIRKVFIGASVTSFVQVLVNIPAITSFQSIFGSIDKRTVFQCLVEGSGVFLISLPFLAVISYFVIRCIFNMKEMRVFYALSMGILLSPVYHYLLFYTPIVKLLELGPYIYGI